MKQSARMNIFERYLSLWVGACMLLGVGLGKLFPGLVAAVRALPRTRIVEEERDYLRVEVRSAFFRFVDDVELAIDADAGLVHFRSASRVGHSDLGANRRRMETLRGLFAR